jgi:hypothetical protein
MANQWRAGNNSTPQLVITPLHLKNKNKGITPKIIVI